MKTYQRRTQNKRRSLLAGAMAALLMTTGVAHASQSSTDTRPIRLLVGFSTGGYTDLIARILAERLGQTQGRNVIVENRPGANGAIAITAVARSPKDGTTMLIAPPGIVTNTLIVPELSYSMQDLAPVARVASLPNVLVVSTNSPYQSTEALLAAARKADGTMTYGSGGVGASNHLAMELLMSKAGVKLLHVPYKGSSLAETDVMAGHVETMFSGAASVVQHVESGRFRALAVSGDHRIPTLPDVPTLAQAGVEGYSHSTWLGLFMAAGTAKDIITEMNRAVNDIMSDPALEKRMISLGADAFQPNTTEEFAAFVDADIAAQKELISGADLDTK